MEAFTNSVACWQRLSGTDFQYYKSSSATKEGNHHQLSNITENLNSNAIRLLSEIIYWYLPKKKKNDYEDEGSAQPHKFLGNAWQTSYEYLEQKLGFKREKLRRNLVKLEQLGLIKRELRTVEFRGQTYNNRLFIHLNPGVVKAPTSSNLYHQYKKSSSSTSDNSSYDAQNSFFGLKGEGGLPRFGGETQYNRYNRINNIRNRSMGGSNFLENSNSNLETSSFSITETTSKEEYPSRNLTASTDKESIYGLTKPSLSISRERSRSLKDFYPLSTEDCSKLQDLSGREFSLRAMNEILLDMSERLKDRFFRTKKGFLSYMSKAFKYEMRDALKVSNETFRIKRNSKIEDQDIQEQLKNDEETTRQEKYLTELESRREVTAEMHLKKKLACVLEKSKAYKLLTAYKFGKRVGEGYELYLSRAVPELTEHDKKLILEQVKATQERVDFGRIGLELITSLKIIEERPKTLEISGRDISMIPEQVFGQMTSKEIAEKLRGQGSIWNQTRAGLIEYLNDHKDSGKWIDRNWFSKLEAEENEEQKTIKLKAPTSFIVRWISDNYASLMKRIIADYGYKVEMC
jgi:DNA-binding Lrp family transcriptional regulator